MFALRPPGKFKALPAAVAACLAVAVGIALIYPLGQANYASIFTTILALAGASAAGGALLGFLFGIPRTVADGQLPQTLRRVTPNTNLEQISDWLTKIIVGVSLVQLGTIVDSLSRLARSIAPALGSQPSSQTVAVCLIVGFAIAGLLAGWTGTRIHLATAINQSDLAIDLIRQAKLASQNGDEETAELLKDQAAEILISLQPISSEYESLRSAVQPSTHRTEQMKMLFDELRDVLRPIVLDLTTVSNLLDSSSDSSRLIGLAYLETHKEEVDTLRILKVIQTSHSAFEQNNALRLLRAKLELQDWADDDATQISSALERIHFTPRSERKQIARDITERLTDQTLNL